MNPIKNALKSTSITMMNVRAIQGSFANCNISVDLDLIQWRNYWIYL